MDLISVGMTAEQAQFLETRKFQRNEIAAIFGVPPHKIGDLERATFSNIEHQAIEVYPVHVMTRKSFGLMTRKLSVTESQRSAQFPGTFPRRKLSVASANWAQVA